ncbi:hypothetical protein [Hydrogenovibrio thermophilus]|uniref:YtxH domain-containing protein n=1 Tax=Hydrogenovibrio thermophilus TaxID=265883 RepID=A0A410H2K2_9GAMM|nr:hypothetical protein [Hydrogenovibrio thermophilus]QAB15142.1 hypothetical protein EPV75_05390 [Hydrogenovibrio thermophilus]
MRLNQSKLTSFAMILAMAFGSMTLVGCSDDPQEDMKESLQDAKESAADAVSNLKDAAGDAADAAEDKVDEAKESMQNN